ncbi:hypothetical protein RCL_jg15537.t1 [Rhizophagus clarus]|uniref:Uncharacterized protein n=1 Tax=Rhizophagus clarus TaxID=94130 RepID=A0A8H3KTW1_9GLOM|nr:hypothetical protein RCL_jg15537.t1 [Rhizophagus clarus]
MNIVEVTVTDFNNQNSVISKFLKISKKSLNVFKGYKKVRETRIRGMIQQPIRKNDINIINDENEIYNNPNLHADVQAI